MDSVIPGIGGGSSKCAKDYLRLLRVLGDEYASPHVFMGEARSAWIESFRSNSSVNGWVFERLVIEVLLRAGVSPFYHQAACPFIPVARYDLVLWHPKNAVVLSVKTSLRERWKQAALEGEAIKRILPASRSLVLTDSEDEAGVLQRRIGDGVAPGLDGCVYVRSEDFTRLVVDDLAKGSWCVPEAVVPLVGSVIHVEGGCE